MSLRTSVLVRCVALAAAAVVSAGKAYDADHIVNRAKEFEKFLNGRPRDDA